MSTNSRHVATSSRFSKSNVKREIGSRVGTGVSNNRQPGDVTSPFGPHSDLPLALDSAIQTALQNNDAFHATLAQIGMADGDRIQAGLLTNPNVTTMIPVGVKQWEWTLYVPIEAFLLRPVRMAIAEKDCERIAHQLVQTGMTLVRDVQLAYTNVALATEQHQLALENHSIRQEIADLTEKRLNAGEIAELEAIQARVDSLNAKADEALLKQNVTIAREQLALLMGIPEQADHIIVASIPEFDAPTQSLEELIEQGAAIRPDLQAAEWTVAAADARYQLSKKAWWMFSGGVDANGSGEKGFELGPAFRFDIPIFNKNEGGIARACAELEAAKYNRDQVKDQIINQVRVAFFQSRRAIENFDSLNSEVLPSLEEALGIAKKGFEDGGTSYLLVLQTTTQYISAKSRILDQAAAACKAHAELELSCGRRLDPRPAGKFRKQ